MGDLVRRQTQKKLSELMIKLGGGSGFVLPDHTAQSEQVIHIVKEEGMGTIAPNDMQCRAATKTGLRHKEDIFFDADMNTFSQFCEDHHEQNALARMNKAKKVTKFVAKPAAKASASKA